MEALDGPSYLDRLNIHGVFRTVLRIAFVTANNLYCIPTYVLWVIILRPLMYFDAKLYFYIEGKLFKWLLAMVAAWSWSAGYLVDEVGEDITSFCNDECLIVANHQSTADVPLLMASFISKDDLVPNVMWLMDKMFKFTNFGVVSVCHGDFFIRAGRGTRESELQALRDHLVGVFCARKRKWLVLFPEGGFLRKRKPTSQKFARENNLPHLENVSLPRLGAMHTIINVMNPCCPKPKEDSLDAYNNIADSIGNNIGEVHANCTVSHPPNLQTLIRGCERKCPRLKWVIDITIAYPHGEPLGLPSIIMGDQPPCRTTLHFRRYPVDEIPTELDDLTTWLFDRWIEKESMLEEFYKTGKFPAMPSTVKDSRVLERPKTVVLDNVTLLGLNILFILSSMFHFYLLKWIYSVCCTFAW